MTMSACRLVASFSGIHVRIHGVSAVTKQTWRTRAVYKKELRRRLSSSSSFAVENIGTTKNKTTSTTRARNQCSSPVLQIQNATLHYPDDSHFSLSIPWLEIGSPGSGGHAVLGTNGSGKSLLTSMVTFRPDRLAKADHHAASALCWPRHVAAVSFDTHQELLLENPSVFAAISDHSGHLSKAAQFLVVRFGLFGLLTRNVHTLSTGEIRKVLVIRALSQLSSPAAATTAAAAPSSVNTNTHNLLILDNAFDGLCVQSREILKEIVRKTIRGFRNDILVQAVSAKATLPTQVLLITHRSEEIVDEITRVTLLHNRHHYSVHARTLERNNRTVQQLFHMALYPPSADSPKDSSGKQDLSRSIMHKELWEHDENDVMPSSDEIRTWWASADSSEKQLGARKSTSNILVHAEHLKIFGNENSTCLIDDLNWMVESGQRWWIAGGNGAGKSSLSRALIRLSQQQQTSQNQNYRNTTLQHQHDGVLHIPLEHAHRLGWVSTELHMTTAKKSVLARDVLLHTDSVHPVPMDVGQTVARWLQIPDAWLIQPFAQLSQGQQKIILIAAALAQRPKLLILDEPLQGCDGIFRRRVLSLVERLAQTIPDEWTLIYITHHPEEVLPCITHVLELERGKCVYQGTRANYETKRKTLMSEQESYEEQQEQFQEFF